MLKMSTKTRITTKDNIDNNSKLCAFDKFRHGFSKRDLCDFNKVYSVIFQCFFSSHSEHDETMDLASLIYKTFRLAK